MKNLFYYLGLITIATMMSCTAKQPPVSLQWVMGVNDVEPGMYSSTFTVKNISDKPLDANWEIYYSHLPRKARNADADSLLVIDDVKPGYYRIRPSKSYTSLAPGDSISVNVITKGIRIKDAEGPEGTHFRYTDADAKPMALKMDKKLMTNPSQWTRTIPTAMPYKYGADIYADNESLACDSTLSEFDIIPAIKCVNIISDSKVNIGKNVAVVSTGDMNNESQYLKEKLELRGLNVVSANAESQIELNIINAPEGKSAEYYEIKIGDNSQSNKIVISGASLHGVFNGINTLMAIMDNVKSPYALRQAVISDYPDLEYRGFMLDVARNFTKPADLKRMIDILATYKVNKLHFHFSEDEGWRLQIPGLEELTDVGSRRGYPYDEKANMYPNFGGGFDVNDASNSANGYYTREDFIDLLQYAAKHHMNVIPEIESPGHARCAVICMKARKAKYADTDMKKATEYQIWGNDDKSVYFSAQAFTDNVMNVAMPGTYKFMEKVIDEVIAMYHDAKVPLETIHVGGDEVPKGSWEGSPAVKKLMVQNGYTEIHQVAEHFFESLTKMIADKGYKTSGWQEVATKHTADFNARVAPRVAGVYVWSTVAEWGSDVISYQAVNDGYPVILCNVNNFYMDLAYSPDKSEPGLNWGGYVNEFSSFDALPYDIYRSARHKLNGTPYNLDSISIGKPTINAENSKLIRGVQSQLWSETIRNFDMVQSYYFPKIFGMVERGWNASPAWANYHGEQHLHAYAKARAAYNKIIGTHELPRLAAEKVNFHLAQPGIVIKNGKLLANAPYTDAVIRYTVDGSEPTANSPQWTAPVDCNADLVKARIYYLGKESVTTLLYKK